MNKVIYKNQDITSYLLGALPEAETEEFDELSFTDDDFADKLKVAEKDLIDAFVIGELKGDNLERFKTYYLASPLRREKVEFAKAFQKAAEKEISQSKEFQKKSLGGFFTSLFTIPRFSLQWGFALATLALMFFGGWLYWENSRLRSEIGQTTAQRTEQLLKRESELAQKEKQLQNEIANQQTTNAETEKELAQIRQERAKLEQELKNTQKRLLERQVAPRPNEKEFAQGRKNKDGGQGAGTGSQPKIASFILLPPLRSGTQLPTLRIPPKTDAAAIQLQMEPNDYQTYRVSLINPSDNQTVWQSPRLRAGTKGKNQVLNLQIPIGLLNSQIYSLEVSGFSADQTAEIISNYSFRVVR